MITDELANEFLRAQAEAIVDGLMALAGSREVSRRSARGEGCSTSLKILFSRTVPEAFLC